MPNGYHIFAAGENGLGKRTLITRLLQQYVKQQPTPSDWVYVHNFVEARTPLALALPAGMEQQLADDVKNFWLATKRQLSQRFRSEHYQSKVEAIKNEISLREEQVYNALHEEGKQYSLALTLRPSDNKLFLSSLILAKPILTIQKVKRQPVNHCLHPQRLLSRH